MGIARHVPTWHTVSDELEAGGYPLELGMEQYRVSIAEALSWQLNKSCLSWELVDTAARELSLSSNDERQGDITVEGNEFVVVFK